MYKGAAAASCHGWVCNSEEQALLQGLLLLPEQQSGPSWKRLAAWRSWSLPATAWSKAQGSCCSASPDTSSSATLCSWAEDKRDAAAPGTCALGAPESMQAAHVACQASSEGIGWRHNHINQAAHTAAGADGKAGRCVAPKGRCPGLPSICTTNQAPRCACCHCRHGAATGGQRGRLPGPAARGARRPLGNTVCCDCKLAVKVRIVCLKAGCEDAACKAWQHSVHDTGTSLVSSPMWHPSGRTAAWPLVGWRLRAGLHSCCATCTPVLTRRRSSRQTEAACAASWGEGQARPVAAAKDVPGPAEAPVVARLVV